jgi:peptidoglycan/xylan/chitin deacetylase (PgdA/CDA1 family)
MLCVMQFVSGSQIVALGFVTVVLSASACMVESDGSRPPVSNQGNAGSKANPGSGGSTSGSGGSGAIAGTTNKGGSEATGGVENVGGTTGGGTSKPVIPPCASGERVCLDSIATWLGNAKGAYTIVHDDLCSYESHYAAAYEELGAVELKAAFGAIAGSCSESWDKIKKLKDAGHEIINHSWSHTDLKLSADTPAQDASDILKREVDESTALINSKLSEQATLFFIFPYDSHNPQAVDRVRAAGYLGARAGKRGSLNPAEFSDSFSVGFDVYGPSNSMYKKLGVCGTENITQDGNGKTVGESEACRRYVLNQYVDDAIAQNGWAVRELHGVEDNSWEQVPLSDYQAHLAYVKSKVTSGALWVAPPSAVLRYRQARDACLPTLASGTLTFPSAETCSKFAVPISVILKPQGSAAGVKVTQAGTTLSAKSLGDGRFIVDLDPLKGSAQLSAE